MFINSITTISDLIFCLLCKRVYLNYYNNQSNIILHKSELALSVFFIRTTINYIFLLLGIIFYSNATFFFNSYYLQINVGNLKKRNYERKFHFILAFIFFFYLNKRKKKNLIMSLIKIINIC